MSVNIILQSKYTFTFLKNHVQNQNYINELLYE